MRSDQKGACTYLAVIYIPGGRVKPGFVPFGPMWRVVVSTAPETHSTPGERLLER